MRRFCVYTYLQSKRTAHYALFVFLMALVICLCLTLALVSLINPKSAGSEEQKIEIGVVGDLNNSYLSFGVSALQTFDSSRFFLDVTTLTKEDAQRKLLNGEIKGYVVITDEFINEALYGKINKLKFFTNSANVGLIDMFKKEVLSLVSCILVESQKGVYGMEGVMRTGCSEDEILRMFEDFSLEYVGLIINRSNAIELEVIGISDHLTLGGYMFSGFSILLMLLSGIVCCPLYTVRDYAFHKRMRAEGLSAGWQITGEYISFFFMMAINTTVLLTLALSGLGKLLPSVPELYGKEISEIIRILVAFIPATALITALQFLLYQLSDSLVSGVLIQFVSSIILGYASGCFYPINFFPKAIITVSACLPSGMARGYLSSLLTDSTASHQLPLILLYTAALLVLSAQVRRLRITKA